MATAVFHLVFPKGPKKLEKNTINVLNYQINTIIYVYIFINVDYYAYMNKNVVSWGCRIR